MERLQEPADFLPREFSLGQAGQDVHKKIRLAGSLALQQREMVKRLGFCQPAQPHQGVRHVPDALPATALAPDGIPEAVELAGHPFGLAVQWHPEWLQAHAPMRGLFEAFVGAAKNGLNRR